MKTPTLSVVIPVHNGANALSQLLNEICNENFRSGLYEVLVVDNNSTEEIEKVVRKFGATYLKEVHFQCPAAARNKGIAHATGSLIALVDADCIPTGNWPRNIFKVFDETKSDLVAGDVQFSFSSKKSLAEICDSITYLQQEETVKKRNLAFTTHLFVKREVFEKVGAFDPALYSSEDIDFVQRALSKGFKLSFSSEVTVIHPARGGIALLRKAFRIGYGKAQLKKKGLLKIPMAAKAPLWKRPQIVNLVPSVLKNKLQGRKIESNALRIFSLQVFLGTLLSLNVLGALYGSLFPKLKTKGGA